MADHASELADLYKPMLEREAIARDLRDQVPPANLYVGLHGVQLLDSSLDVVPGCLSIRRVTNPPGLLHVLSAAVSPDSAALGSARYSDSITAELAVSDPDKAERISNLGLLHGMVFHAAGLIKLKSATLLCAPASSSASWDVIAAHTGDVTFGILDDTPCRIRVQTTDTPTVAADIAWVRDHYTVAFEMRNHEHSRRFGLAFNVAYTWNHTDDMRQALANLWFGMEALFGDQRDRPVTKRLVDRVTSWVSGWDAERVGDLYDRRCDAVHGRWVDDTDLVSPVADSWALLRECMMSAIDRGASPLADWT